MVYLALVWSAYFCNGDGIRRLQSKPGTGWRKIYRKYLENSKKFLTKLDSWFRIQVSNVSGIAGWCFFTVALAGC